MEKGHSRKRKDSPSGLGNVLGMVSVNHFFFLGGGNELHVGDAWSLEDFEWVYDPG